MKEPKWNSRERARQLINFEGLRDGKKWPTDIDGLFDCRGQAFLFFEFKYKDAPMPLGQRLALENLVNTCGDAGRPAVALVVEHTVQNPLDDVDAALGVVRECYWHNSRIWRPPTRRLTLREACDAFILQNKFK